MTEPVLKEVMTGTEVKIELMRRGIKLANIAEMADVTRPAVTRTLCYDDSYECLRVTDQIAQVFGLKALRIIKKPKKRQTNRQTSLKA